jgi:hypothetical protein
VQDVAPYRPDHEPHAARDPRHRAQQRSLRLAIDPGRERAPLDRIAQALERLVAADHETQQHRERERAAPGDARDLLEAAPEDVAEQAEGDAPRPGAEHVVGEEAPVADPRGAGRERHQRAHEADPAAQEDRLAAVAIEEPLDLGEALLRETHLGPMPDDEVAPQSPAEQEPDPVADQHRGPHDPDQELDREGALACQHAPEDDRELARCDESEEGCGLRRRHERDQQVSPLAESIGQILDQVLDHGEAQFGRRPTGRVADCGAPVVNIRLPKAII